MEDKYITWINGIFSGTDHVIRAAEPCQRYTTGLVEFRKFHGKNGGSPNFEWFSDFETNQKLKRSH